MDLTFALQIHIHGLQVFPLHVINLLIHCMNGLLAYAVTANIFTLAFNARQGGDAPQFSPRWPVLMATAFFLLHPVQTQAVTYLSQRYTSLMASFYLGAVWAFLRFRQEGRPLWAVLVGLWAYGAFLCKQSAVTLPLSLLVLEMVLFSEHFRFWKRWGTWFFAAVSLAFLGILWNIGVFSASMESGRDWLEDVDRLSRETLMVSRRSYFLTQLRVLCLYLGLVLWPWNQCVDHQYPFVHRFFDGWTPFAAAFLLVLLALAWRSRHRFPVVTCGLLWFFAALSLESSFIPIRDAMFEHRLYVALLGFGWILGWAWMSLTTIHRRLSMVAVLVFLTALGVATHFRNRVWQDPVTLWREATLCNPRNARAFNNLGRHLMDAGRLDEAEKALVQARALNPFRPNIHYNLGMIYGRTQRFQEAVQAFSTALALDPRQAVFYYHLGLSYHHLKLKEAARTCYEAALVQDSTLEGPAMNLAAFAFAEGRYAEARTLLEPLTRRPSPKPQPFYYLSLVLQAQGHRLEALEAVEKASHLDPENPDILFQKAVLLVENRRTQEALTLLRLLKERRPHDERVSFYLDKLSALEAEGVGKQTAR